MQPQCESTADAGRSRFLAGLSGPELKAVLAQATERRLPANAIVIHEDAAATELLLIARGRARYFATTPDGDKILLRWLPPGDVLGGAALLPDPSTYRVSAETVRETSLLVWNRRAIRGLAARCPRLVENALSITCDYLGWYLAAHVALSSQTARQRLAGVLLSLAPIHGRAAPGGVELAVTNDELASAAHISTFTASRLLSEWHRSRVVLKRRGRVVLLAPKRLIASIG